ncbi:ATP-binding protein [Telmatospirillum siberiense]|uniref:histidine kinase n=1 Tax=Telmatospirillum siberiense TaxID=382514 RepID=A0A2N3Q0B0_9PROT|nr:ATP-binding protein [Telmatospirillum siberiense]PKU26086.1 hypothetical protein CWS72_02840 [Telmatospirillum siberiense]
MKVRREPIEMPRGFTGKGIFAAAVLIDLFVIALVGLAIHQSYLQSRSRVEAAAGNLSRVLEQSVVGVIERIDLGLRAVADEFERERSSDVSDEQRFARIFKAQKERLPDIISLRVAGPTGLVIGGTPEIAGPPVSIADRDYFIRLRADPQAGLVLSKPLEGRASPGWSIVFARRLSMPDGSFAGIVLAAVGLDRFQELFSTLDVGPHGSVSLRDGDFVLLARFPQVPDTANLAGVRTPSKEFQKRVREHPNGGLYRARASIDDVERVFSFRKLSSHPLYVIVGLAEVDNLTEWRNGAMALGGLAACFVITTLLAGRFLERSWKARERALSEAEVATARLRAILQNSPIGLGIVGIDRTLQLVNKTLADIFGISSEGLLGQSAERLYGSRAQFDDLGRRAYPVILSGGTFSDQILMHRQDASTFWCRMRARLLDVGSPSLGVAWVMEDISEQKRNEQQLALYRSLIEYTSDCVYVISPRQGFRMVFANDAACAHYGVPREELLTWRLPDWDVGLQDTEALDEFWHEVKLKKSLLIETKHRVHTGAQASALVPVEMSANYLFHEGEEFIAGYFHNTVARMAAERALTDKTRELARSNTDLEQFAYVASHDLREPLRMVSSYLGLLERRLAGHLSDEAREFIGYAKDGAERMDRLILDLLDYSRIGRASRPLEPVCLAEVVAEVAGNLKTRIEEVGGVLEIHPAMPTVLGDRQELVRLFQNLVANALKYHAPDCPPKVVITARQRRKEWVVSVADNGIGIAPQHFERIFGIFQRLHPRRDYDGTGIGLAVCKKIVEHHGGAIWVQSTPGEGSEFFVSFPEVTGS